LSGATVPTLPPAVAARWLLAPGEPRCPLVRAGGRIHGAAEHLGGVAAQFGTGSVPVHIHHEGLAAAVLDGLHHPPHKDRMNGRIDHVIAGMHLDHDRFLVDPVAQVKLFKDQV